MSLPSSETKPMSKLSARLAEKTISRRSSETSNDWMAAKCGVSSLPAATSVPLFTDTLAAAGCGAHSTLLQRSVIGGAVLIVGRTVTQPTKNRNNRQIDDRTKKHCKS